MKKLSSIIIVGALIVLVGSGLFLATKEYPVPATEIERTIPNERFPR